MAQLVLNTVLGSDCSGVTTTDDDDGTLLGGIDNGVESVLGTLGERLQLEDARRTVPEDGLGLSDGLLVQLNTLLTDIQTHVTVGNAFSIGSIASLRVSGELVGGNIVDGKDNLDVVLLGLLNDLADDLATSLVEQTVTDLDVLEGLLESEGHSTGDDEAVDLGQEVVDQLNLVRDLGTTQNGKEWSLGALQSLSEVVKLLLDQETGSLLGQLDTDHGAVGTVSGTESIV